MARENQKKRQSESLQNNDSKCQKSQYGEQRKSDEAKTEKIKRK